MGSVSKKSDELEELDWITIQNIKRSTANEPFWEKLKRKTKENPLVPIGVVTTVGALSVGLYSMGSHNPWMSQYMMRLRVGAQAFTVIAMVTGMAMSLNKKKEEIEAAKRSILKEKEKLKPD